MSREQVVAAADAIARRDGIARLMVRPLCTELGVTAPAIYRLFPTKDLIVEQVIDDAIDRIDLPGPESGDWADRLRQCFISAHDVVAGYPGLAARMGQQMPRSPAARRTARFLSDLLTDAGIGPDDAGRIGSAVVVYAWGHLLAAEAAAGLFDASPFAADSRAQFLWGLDHLLASFRRQFDL